MAGERAMPWVDGLTIGQVLAETACKFPGNDALVFPQFNLRMNYAALDRTVTALAKGLLAVGIKPGEHVAVWATNIPEWPMLQLATARIGAVLVTINPAYRPFELKYALEQSDNVALFLTDKFKTSSYYDIFAEVCPELSTSKPGSLKAANFPKLRTVVAMKSNGPQGMLSWSEVLEQGKSVSDAELAKVTQALKASDPINIQYTSGTTGFPKAARLTHRNILLNAYYVTGCQNITERDRMCVPVPFYHCFGCVMGSLGAVVRGAAMVVPAEYFTPVATLDAIEKERATTIYGVPTMFIAMLEDASFKGRDLKSLRSGIMAGSPCPIEVMKRVIHEMGAKEITIAYGQTETSPVLTQTTVNDPIELRVETVGPPLPGVEVKIIDPETGAELGDNQQGELCARGHCNMLGYYKNPEGTAKTIDTDGWVHTGDLAIRRPEGYYKITGRMKDMVIRGGENIYPREIEEFLFTHPSVKQASVVGVPDDKYGEELCAWIQLHEGAAANAEEIRAFCKSNLAHYKVPR
ncbi:MAG: AMP-binding protein, partial [Alphaproteobacteria bacterium]|nr:AMP-binding protein [Alphaproteobacteria bacterium]